MDIWSFASKLKPGNGKSRLSFVLQAHPKKNVSSENMGEIIKFWLGLLTLDSAISSLNHFKSAFQEW